MNYSIFCCCRIHRYSYEEEAYERRSIQRSLSQPSLARSATEFTERWAIPDDVSDNSSVDRSRQPSRIMVNNNNNYI